MSLHRIFDDEQFYVRCDRLSKISHEYPGYANGAREKLKLSYFLSLRYLFIFQKYIFCNFLNKIIKNNFKKK